MVLLILESVLLAVGMGLVLLPLRRGAAGITRGVEVGGGSSPFHTGGREAARRRVLVGLAELEMDYRTGKVSDEDYRVMKDDLLARGTAGVGPDPAGAREAELRRRLEAEVADAVRNRVDGWHARRDGPGAHRSAGVGRP